MVASGRSGFRALAEKGAGRKVVLEFGSCRLRWLQAVAGLQVAGVSRVLPDA